MKGKAFALLLLLGLAALSPSVASVVEDDDAPEAAPSGFLLVRRKVSSDKLQVGKVAKVTVELHNAGKGAAKSISVEETAWHPGMFLTEGQLTAEFDAILPGSTETFSYSVTAKDDTTGYKAPDTTVTYIAEDNGKPITIKAPTLKVIVVTSTDILKEKALSIGSTVSLGMLKTESDWITFIVVGGGAALAYVLYGAYTTFKEARDASKRDRAIKDLGVDLKSE